MNTRSQRPFKSLSPFLLLVLLSTPVWLTGCSRYTQFAKNRADRQGYRIIADKQEAALGTSAPFTIETQPNPIVERLRGEFTPVADFMVTEYTTPTIKLNLSDVLSIAMTNSRRYQTQKESLFSQALGLNNTRYDYGVQFSAAGSAEYNRRQSGHGSDDPETVERYGGYSYILGASKRLAATGARISANFSHNVTRFFRIGADPTVSNSASLSVVQPLLNGFGPLVAGEQLRQSERNMIYAVRNFKRFQQSFVIDTASSYYRLLQALDQLANEQRNFQTAVENRDRQTMLAEAGRLARFEVDQANQRELEAANRWTNAQANYLSQLDQFKFSLGLPVDLQFGPDPQDLLIIADQGLNMPDLTLADAVAGALENRMDLQNVADSLEDSTRHVRIAARNFLPNLDARYNFFSSKTSDTDEIDLNLRNHTQTFSLDLSLPLDWTPRRNNYRQALISQARAIRELEATQDSVILEVRDNWRQLERSRKNYEIQLQSIMLAERRIESVSLLIEAGRATTRDLLDAQDAYLLAQNALTSALVDHTIRRLQFWNAIERLEIDPQGMWYEVEPEDTNHDSE